MPNPILPAWEYVPDGEPHVFGDRLFLYGSHDRVDSAFFCDYKLKAWSTPVQRPGEWTCHGHIFHTAGDTDHAPDTEHSNNELYAPDVAEMGGKYYLFAYVFGAKGCVAVSDRPEGPFRFLSLYEYPPGHSRDEGIFNDPGVLVDDDGRVYIYCGYEKSYMAELDPKSMFRVIEGSHRIGVLPPDPPISYFEASSPRKIGDTYYLIYSPRIGSRLDYATSKSPTGPFAHRGTIIDNAVDYPGGNNHGSICKVGDQWYVFYHRMTNGTIMSRRACAERIKVLPDGSIPQVEMSSLGFDESLNPYRETPADYACVLKGGCFITERSAFERPVTAISHGCVIGFKHFDFGSDFSSKTMKLALKVRGLGSTAKLKVLADDYDHGEEIGECEIGRDDGVYEARLKSLSGRHAIFFKVEHGHEGWDWAVKPFETRALFELESLLFMK